MSETASLRAGARAGARARRFRALDGEGVTLGRGDAREHRYVLLGTDDDSIFDPDGIRTVDAFDFILRQASRKDLLVAFAFNYDVNMILRDVAHDELQTLWRDGEAFVELEGQRYFVEWIPGKLFGLSTTDPVSDRKLRAKVWDCWGFFQASFVKALEAWRVDDESGTVAQMKRQRSRFTLDQIEEIRAYNARECVLLARLMDAVRDALHAVELRPRSWLGAGSIASALLLRHDVDAHVSYAHERSPTLSEDVLLRAYFGGRTEVFRQGVFAEAVACDINSAYPAAAVQLPTAHGRWRRVREYDEDAQWAVWKVSWRIPDGAPVAPFPYRQKRAIHYPLQGAGFYHAVELRAAIDAYGPEFFDVGTGYVFEPATDDRPFAFIADVFEQRRELKRDGHPSEKVLKLGINSVYGKLAQGHSRGGIRPRFQDYFWSGWITAHTRAQVFAAIMQLPERACAVATDGVIFADDEPALDEGSGLGQWERTSYRDLFIAQPGMYYAIAGRKTIKRSRGFFTKEINFPALQQTWIEDGPNGMQICRTHRFVGLGTALLRRNFDVWRKWEDGTRTLSLYSSRKHYDDADAGGRERRLYPPLQVSRELSERYVPKRAVLELDPDEAEWIQGNEQPQLAGEQD